MTFDPARKRRQLAKRGWSEKRIDAYMQHIKFNLRPTSDRTPKHEQHISYKERK